MNRTDALYQSFLEILREELVPAMGCTEPIAIAYAAAQARAVLGKRPERVRIEVSGNIIKNVKSVIVPHTGSMHGIAAAAAAGIIAGREDRELEVLSEVTQAQIEEMRAYLKEAAFEIRPIDSPFIFDIRITVCADGDQATARIVGSHQSCPAAARHNAHHRPPVQRNSVRAAHGPEHPDRGAYRRFR